MTTLAAAAASFGALLIIAAAAHGATGDLTQKPGTAACISEDGSGGDCVNGVGLDTATTVTVSPDGTSAYVASAGSDAVAVFDRNATTGELTQKPGTAACISETGSGGDCADGVGLDGTLSVTVSPDGASAYVASTFTSSAVAVFDRNTTTGELTQKPGTAACISDSGSGGACVDGVGLASVRSVTVSPDGTNAYATASTSSAVAIFDRNTTTGELTQKPGTAGCISEDGSGGDCVDGVGLNAAASVTVSPDGTSAYVASSLSDAVAVFDRNTTTGALTQKPGTAACISETGSGGDCVNGAGLNGARSVTLSPDGTSAYVASQGSNAVAVFDRNTATGELTQKPGTAACISETGSFGECADGVGLGLADSVTVSPDGTNAYATAFGSGAVAVFDRNTTTGALTQKAGAAGVGLNGPTFVTVSPDGTSAYVASQNSDAVAVFDRQAAPETSIDTGPSGTTSDATPTFSFSSDTAGSSFECQVNLGGWAECVSPTTTFGLADGPKRFRVRATDSGGNVSAAVSSEFVVDTTAPTTTISSGPSGTTTDRSASFAFTSSEAGSSFECSLDSGTFGACSSPKSYSNLADGPHSFAVRASDSAANTGAAASRSFTVTTPLTPVDPDTTVDGSASAKKSQKQKGSKIAVKAKVSAGEDLEVSGSGKIKLGNKSYKLKNKTKSVSSGESKNLKLKPKKSKDRKKLVKALKQGKKPKATLELTLTDGLANTASTELTVRLKR